jgi:UDP-N-acetylmuramoyl-L-alanyl-D-glutamate--2,6-diaminopimelate ligase
LPFPPAPPWADDLVTVGVTGTNGKTSTTTWVAAGLGAIGGPVARVTTIGSFLDDESLDVDASYDGFLETMRLASARGARCAAIELTSEALALGFAGAWPCRVGVFTNLSHDHLDAHGSPEHYLASKAQLFVRLPPGGAAVLNGRDPASRLLEEIIPAGVRVIFYGLSRADREDHALHERHLDCVEYDLVGRDVEVTWEGTRVALEAKGDLGPVPEALRLRAIGSIYAENAVAALAAAIAAGAPPEAAARAIEATPAPPGRFEVICGAPGGQENGEAPRVVVDYAHTPDALARTLETARSLCRPPGALVVVFGAGGNRDRDKRAPMGAAAAIADRVVLTSDNPRDEDPAAIAAAIREGLSGHRDVEVELDRAAAITGAIGRAAPGDVVVIAGKGHERDQTAGGARRPFSDVDVARAAARLRG